MSVRTGQAKLATATKALLAVWRETKEKWQDDNCRAFEEEVLVPLQMEIRKIDLAMTHLDTILGRIHSDCS